MRIYSCLYIHQIFKFSYDSGLQEFELCFMNDFFLPRLILLMNFNAGLMQQSFFTSFQYLSYLLFLSDAYCVLLYWFFGTFYVCRNFERFRAVSKVSPGSMMKNVECNFKFTFEIVVKFYGAFFMLFAYFSLRETQFSWTNCRFMEKFFRSEIFTKLFD